MKDSQLVVVDDGLDCKYIKANNERCSMFHTSLSPAP